MMSAPEPGAKLHTERISRAGYSWALPREPTSRSSRGRKRFMPASLAKLRAMLPKSELFARLAEGHAAGITVVTPNVRLSQALLTEFDAHQIGRGLSVWEAADILPFSAFVIRLYEDALYTDLGEKLPMLL